jgi:hypothetical protein
VQCSDVVDDILFCRRRSDMPLPKMGRTIVMPTAVLLAKLAHRCVVDRPVVGPEALLSIRDV